MEREVKKKLKRGEKVATQNLVNKYAQGGMSKEQFVNSARQQQSDWDRARAGNANKTGR